MGLLKKIFTLLNFKKYSRYYIISFIFITWITFLDSNSLITHPEDGPENLALQNQREGWTFPYLLDHHQNFAKALKAACTPDFFLFSPFEDGNQKLCYRGQLDDSRPSSNIPLNGADLRAAIDAVKGGGSR